MEERNGGSLTQPPLNVPLLVVAFSIRLLADSWTSYSLSRHLGE